MAFRTEILFSAPTPEDEMERTDIVGKALPKVRELQAHLKELGLEVTLTVKSVNSVAGRPGPAKRRTRTAAAPVSYQDAAA